MTETNYPPSRTYTLGAALEAVKKDIDDTERKLEEIKAQADAEDPDPDNLDAAADLLDDLSRAQTYRDALSWAVEGDGEDFEGWGEDATISLEATTSRKRSRAQHTITNRVMGDLGDNSIQDALIAASIDEAPFVDGDDDLVDTFQIVSTAIPPALRDWLNEQIEDLNDINPGN